MSCGSPVFPEQLSLQERLADAGHRTGLPAARAQGLLNIKPFTAGAGLVVKNYIPSVTQILQRTLSPFPSELYSVCFKRRTAGLMQCFFFKKNSV